MKITRQKSNKKALIIGSVAAVIVVASIGGYFVWQYFNPAPTPQTVNAAPTNTVDYSPPTEEQQQAQNAQKEGLIDGTSNGTPSGTISISITRAGQSAAGQAVNVRTFVTGTSTGTCELTFSQPGQTSITKTFTVAPDVSSSTCNGDVDISNFSVGGQWQLSVIVKKGSEVSAPATWDLTVNK